MLLIFFEMEFLGIQIGIEFEIVYKYILVYYFVIFGFQVLVDRFD